MPNLSHMTGPCLVPNLAKARCGMVPRSNMLPMIGKPRGPGGSRLVVRILCWIMVKIGRKMRKMAHNGILKGHSMDERSVSFTVSVVLHLVLGWQEYCIL